MVDKNKTKNRKMKGGEKMTKLIEKESGITLIALIITIIILVILAAVSVRAVYNMGIVDYAVNGTQNYAKAAVAENQMLDETGRLIQSALGELNDINKGEKTVVLNGVESTGDIKIKLSISGTRVTSAPIPSGFRYKEGSISDGYVITDGTNEFVWVPVDKNQKISLEVNPGEADITDITLYAPNGEVILNVADNEVQAGEKYTNLAIEPKTLISDEYLNGAYAVTATATASDGETALYAAKFIVIDSLYAKTLNCITNELVQELAVGFGANWQTVSDIETWIASTGAAMPTYVSMLYGNNISYIVDAHDTTGYDFTSSVASNGGFYIGRYEAGTATARTTGNSSDTVNTILGTNNVNMPVSKRDQIPYNYITRDQARQLAESMYPNASFTCTLLTGSAWDRTLGFITEAGANNKTDSQVYSNSGDWGNYRDVSFELTRGKYTYWDSNNGGLVAYKNYNEETTNYVEKNSSNKYMKTVYDNTLSDSNNGQTLLTTGAIEDNSAKNIYDLAGNVWEWTLRDSTYRDNATVHPRGGSYDDSSYDTAFYCIYNYTSTYYYSYVGFRPALYL